MKACYVHKKAASENTCKICGKAMCEECDSFTGHVGICPHCVLKGWEKISMVGVVIKSFLTILIPVAAIYAFFMDTFLGEFVQQHFVFVLPSVLGLCVLLSAFSVWKNKRSMKNLSRSLAKGEIPKKKMARSIAKSALKLLTKI